MKREIEKDIHKRGREKEINRVKKRENNCFEQRTMQSFLYKIGCIIIGERFIYIF